MKTFKVAKCWRESRSRMRYNRLRVHISPMQLFLITIFSRKHRSAVAVRDVGMSVQKSHTARHLSNPNTSTFEATRSEIRCKLSNLVRRWWCSTCFRSMREIFPLLSPSIRRFSNNFLIRCVSFTWKTCRCAKRSLHVANINFRFAAAKGYPAGHRSGRLQIASIFQNLQRRLTWKAFEEAA